MSAAWKELLKKPYLSQKPQLTQGLADYNEDRDLSLAFKNLRDLEDHCKKLYKEVRRHEECANGLHRLERKMSSDLTNSPLCREYEDGHQDLKKVAEDYQSVVYQLGHATGDLTHLSQKTVVEPMKKLTAEFGSIAAALKKRDATLNECLKCQTKVEKLAKLDKTQNAAKIEQGKKSYLQIKDDFDTQNRLLLLELPQFYEKRVDYFQPCLQALIRAQVDYYGESTRLFTHLVSTNASCSNYHGDDEYQEEIERNLSVIKSLSIPFKF